MTSYWTVTKIVLTAKTITASLSRLEFFIPADDDADDDELDDAEYGDDGAEAYETGQQLDLQLDDMIGIGDIVRITAERMIP